MGTRRGEWLLSGLVVVMRERDEREMEGGRKGEKETKTELQAGQESPSRVFISQGHGVSSAYMDISEYVALTEAGVRVIEYIHLLVGSSGPHLGDRKSHTLILPWLLRPPWVGHEQYLRSHGPEDAEKKSNKLYSVYRPVPTWSPAEAEGRKEDMSRSFNFVVDYATKEA